LNQTAIDHILVVDGGVFRRISVDNAVLVARAGEPPPREFSVAHGEVTEDGLKQTATAKIAVQRALSDEHALFTGSATRKGTDLWDRLQRECVELGSLAFVNFGKQLRDRKKYPDDVRTIRRGGNVPRGYLPCYTGRNVTRYGLEWANLVCLDDEAARRGGCWDPARQNAKNKLLTRQIGRHPDFAIDACGYNCLNTVFMVNLKAEDISPLWLLGVLNSRLLRAFWLQRFYDQRRTFPKIKGTYLKLMPIRLVDTSEGKQGAGQNRIIRLVETRLSLNEKLAAARTPQDKTSLQRQITATDHQIDRLVYELYGLTDAEIALVEEAAR
jgi:hypothetical protein